MKNYLLLSVLGFSFSFTGCGEKESTEENTENTETRTEPEGANPGECSDGADNDFDGDYDCNDTDCAGAPDCLESNCADGADNDADGLFDCDDPDCAEDAVCADDTEGDEAGECTDGVDNDADGLIDCDDPNCQGSTDCESTDCNSIDTTETSFRVEGTSDLHLTDGFTVEAWVKVEPYMLLNGDTLIMSKHNCGGDSGGWFMGLNGGVPLSYINSNLGIVYSNTSIVDGQWHHLATVYDGSVSSIFVDGVLKGSALVQYTNTNENNWSISGCDTGTNVSFYGLINAIRISDTPRYSLDFTPIYSFDTDSNTLANWTFDSDLSIIDSSTNTFEGSFSNATWFDDCPAEN